MKNNTIRVGCSSFSVGFWKGVFYPPNLPSKEYLSFYSQKMRAVEINTTFYGRPTLKTLERWHHSTPVDFLFFIKMPKAITHEKRLKETRADAEDFCGHIAGSLGKKLAGFLYQLPPSFHYSEENLQRVLDTAGQTFRNVVEFRHASWWTAEVQNVLRENNIIFCGVSYPGAISDEVIVNNDKLGYYRLHGVPELFKSSYSDDKLGELSQKINSQEREFFVFFNNTFGTAGILNALTFRKLLGQI